MNFAMIFRILGWMLMFEAAFMAPSGVVAAIYREGDVIWLIISMVICLAAGALTGGFVSAKLNKGAGLIAGAAAALIMLAALTVTAMLKGNVSVSPLILFRLAGMLLGGCIGGALGIGERKKNKI